MHNITYTNISITTLEIKKLYVFGYILYTNIMLLLCKIGWDSFFALEQLQSHHENLYQKNADSHTCEDPSCLTSYLLRKGGG